MDQVKLAIATILAVVCIASLYHATRLMVEQNMSDEDQ